MRRRPLVQLGLLSVVILGLVDSTARAQYPAPYLVSPGTRPCGCGVYPGPHFHLGGPPAMHAGRSASGFNAGGVGNGNAVSPNEQGLPRGRRYYGGRYFGSLNNRYYGPQYGYF